MPPTNLGSYEGKTVIRAAVKITRAGDGLSEALTVAPVALHHGDEVFYVLRGIVVDVQHPQVNPADPDLLVRKHVVVTQDITQVAKRDVKALLDKAKLDLQEAKDKQAGVEGMIDGKGNVKSIASATGTTRKRRPAATKKVPVKT